MSNVLMQMALGAHVNNPLTLSGGDGGLVQQDDFAPHTDTTVAIRFNTNGTVETGGAVDGAAITWSAAGNWIINGTPSIDFDVRFTNLVIQQGPGDWTTEAAADDIWIDLGTQRVWTKLFSSTAQREHDCDFEVRDGGGAPPATGSSSYTFHIRNFV